MFYPENKSIRNCNRRLKILYKDMYCIDRFFPPVKTGSSKQHLVIDRGAKYALGLDNFYKIDKLPLHYRHHKAVAEFHIQAELKGLGQGKLEYKLAGYKTDIYYPSVKMAVEIDTGFEVYKTLENKTKKFNRLNDLEYLLFITEGSQERINYFNKNIKNSIKVAGCKFEDLEQLLDMLKSKRVF